MLCDAPHVCELVPGKETNIPRTLPATVGINVAVDGRGKTCDVVQRCTGEFIKTIGDFRGTAIESSVLYD